MRAFLCVIALAWCIAAQAADTTIVRPMPDLSKPIVLYLPKAGQTCELTVLPQRLYQWPATELDAPSVTQGQPMAKVGDRLDPIPPPEGDFDLKGYRQELLWGGRGIKISFSVPDKMTTINLTTHSPIWNNIQALRGGVYYGAKDSFQKIDIEIYPMMPWDEFIEAVGPGKEASP